MEAVFHFRLTLKVQGLSMGPPRQHILPVCIGTIKTHVSVAD